MASNPQGGLPDGPVGAALDGMARRLVSPVLVGRDAELTAMVSAVAGPSPTVVVVEGEAGVGKTRLVTALLDRPEVLPLRSLMGRCHPIRESFPLGPVIEAVRGLGEELSGLELNPVAGALRPLLPELSAALPPALEPLDDRAAQRHRVFRGLVQVLAATGPTVLVVEDLHWADAQTADFLAYLLAERPRGLALVLTYRSEDAGPAIRALQTRLASEAAHARIALSALDVDRTGALVAAILGVDGVSAEFSAYLWRLTSGSPFAVEEVLALLRARGVLAHEQGRWWRRALEEIGVPTGIRDSTLERVSRLSAAAQGVVEASAVLQDLVVLPVLHAMVDGPVLTDGYDEAIASGLLVETSGQVGFRHALAAQAVYSGLGNARRRLLHGRAADAFLAQDAVPWGQAAHHLKLAGRLDEWAGTAELAADQAMGLGHDEEATRLLDEVLREAPLDQDRRGQVAVKLGRAATQTLHTQELVSLLSSVLEQDLPQVVRGELRYLTAMAMHQSGTDDYERERGLFAQAIVDLDDRPDLKARALVALGTVSRMDPGYAGGWVDQSLALARESDDVEVEVFVLGKAGAALIRAGDPGWHSIVDRVMEISSGAPRTRDEVNAFLTLGGSALYVGHLGTAESLLTKGLRAAVAGDFPRLGSVIRADRAFLTYRHGQWEGLAAEAAAILDELADARPYRLAAEVVAGCLALARGSVDQARAELADTLEAALSLPDPDIVPVAADAAVRAAIDLGDVTGAVAVVRRCWAVLKANGDWAHAVQLLPSVASALVAGDAQDEARQLVATMGREVRGRDFPLGPVCVRHAVGLVTASAEDLEAAAGMYREAGLPYETARVSEQAARVLLDADDTEAAGPVLVSAVAGYERLGALADRSRAAGLARQFDVGLPAAHRGGSRGYGAELSPREREVAALAAAGRTNSEIAAELFISRHTVEKHLGAAMRKLNLRSRTELARQWVQVRGAGGAGAVEDGGFPV